MCVIGVVVEFKEAVIISHSSKTLACECSMFLQFVFHLFVLKHQNDWNRSRLVVIPGYK